MKKLTGTLLPKPGLLMVANWDSDVGYAWWLMESYWALIARRYSSDYRVVVAFPSISKIPDSLKNCGIEFVLCKFVQSRSDPILPSLMLLWRLNVKLIYFSDHPTYSWMYVVYRLLGVRRIITHDHTPGVRRMPHIIKAFVKRILNRLPWLSATDCIGASDFVRDRLLSVNCVPAFKCFAVPNGIRFPAIDLQSAGVRGICGVNPTCPVVITVARANRYKGVDFALEVFATLVADHPDLDFAYVFIGDGPDLEGFKTQAMSLGLSRRVYFLGRVTDVGRYLVDANIAFHPSSGEVGYCLAILEYMYASLPVVVPDNPSVCGATDHESTGLKYTDGCVEDAASKLLQLICAPALSGEFGCNARKIVEDRYSLARSHEALTAIFDKIV